MVIGLVGMQREVGASHLGVSINGVKYSKTTPLMMMGAYSNVVVEHPIRAPLDGRDVWL